MWHYLCKQTVIIIGELILECLPERIYNIIIGLFAVYAIIINRWGQELYKGLGGWDGTYNGKEMSAGTYFYMITLPNGKTFNGPLMLIRN